MDDTTIRIFGRWMSDEAVYSGDSGRPVYVGFELPYGVITNVLH